VHMIEAAIRDNDHFRVSRVETRRREVSYTIDTMRQFARRFAEIYFIVGLDAFADIGLWKDGDELFSYAHFIVMVRPGSPIRGLPQSLEGNLRSIGDSTWEHVSSGKRVFLHRITQLDISSTRIRELVRSGRSIKYLVPRAVERHIKKRGLYTN
jgi:nicotinate-nucleotide adenylyltransferase